MVSKVILVVLAIIVVFVLYQRFTAVRISGGDARVLVSEGAMLVDVRSPGEFSGGHIEGARSLPFKWTGYIDWIEIVRSKNILPEDSLILYG